MAVFGTDTDVQRAVCPELARFLGAKDREKSYSRRRIGQTAKSAGLAGADGLAVPDKGR